jgi:hypothetical protein
VGNYKYRSGAKTVKLRLENFQLLEINIAESCKIIPA